MLQYLSINVATIVSTCFTIDVAWNVVFMLRLEYPKVERQLFLTYHFFILQIVIFDVALVNF